MTPQEAEEFFKKTLLVNWPKFDETSAMEYSLFCKKLLPYTVEQAEAGVVALLESDDRRFRPTVSQLFNAIQSRTGPGRAKSKRGDYEDRPSLCWAENQAFWGFVTAILAREHRQAELFGYELIVRAAARGLNPEGEYGRELVAKTLAAGQAQGQDVQEKVNQAVRLGMASKPPEDRYVISELATSGREPAGEE